MTDDDDEKLDQQELTAMFVAARANQAMAEKAVAELKDLVATILGTVAQTAREGTKVMGAIGEIGEQVLAHIDEGAEKAMRRAAVNDVGTMIEDATAAPLQRIEASIKRMDASTQAANAAAYRVEMSTQTVRLQQLAITALCSFLIGAGAHWYLATRGPFTEAAEYILFLKNRAATSPDPPPRSSGNTPKTQKTTPSTKPKRQSPPETTPDPTVPDTTTPAPDSAEPPPQ